MAVGRHGAWGFSKAKTDNSFLLLFRFCLGAAGRAGVGLGAGVGKGNNESVGLGHRQGRGGVGLGAKGKKKSVPDADSFLSRGSGRRGFWLKGTCYV